MYLRSRALCAFAHIHPIPLVFLARVEAGFSNTQYQFITKWKVHVACAHRLHAVAASSSTQSSETNDASATSQLATPLRARSLLSDDHIWMDSDTSAYPDEA